MVSSDPEPSGLAEKRAPRSKQSPDRTKKSSRMGGEKLASWAKSRSSPVRLIYTMPMDMHPSSGETSSISQSPQKAKRTPRARIRRLSVVRVAGSSHLSSSPHTPPSISMPRVVPMGTSRSPTGSEERPVRLCRAKAMAALYASRLTTSSRATTCSRVSTSSP